MTEDKKNVLIIFCDQLMRDAIGCMDNPDVYTPNIDRLADNGVLFKSAYTTTPICSPFRATLVTGMYNLETGADANNCRLPEGCHSLVTDFNDAGYRTGFVGKWHMGSGGNNPIKKEFRADFQECIGYQCYNSFYGDVWFFDEDDQKHVFDGHRTDVTGDIAIERLGHMTACDDPFLLVVGFQAPHYPEHPSPDFDLMYRGKHVSPRPNYTGVSPYIPTHYPKAPSPKEQCPYYQRYGEDIHEYLRCYYALCTQIDHNVGRILGQLEESGKMDDTFIVFTSDHGDLAGSHGLNGKCHSYEEGAGIPLIMAGPGLPKGMTIHAPIDSAAILPTCMELVGVEMPERIRSRSQRQLFENPTLDTRAIACIAWNNWAMIRKGTKKLTIEYSTLKPIMFFDVSHDPYEMNNLVEDQIHSDELQGMLKELLDWKDDTTAYGKETFGVSLACNEVDPL